MKNVTVAKCEQAFTRCRNNLKMVLNWMVKTRCKTLIRKKSTYTLRVIQSRSKSVYKMFVFIIFECSHDALSKMCWLEFRFQNLPPSRFRNLPAKKCRFRVNGRPIRQIFHRFQTMLESCGRGLNDRSRYVVWPLLT